MSEHGWCCLVEGVECSNERTRGEITHTGRHLPDGQIGFPQQTCGLLHACQAESAAGRFLPRLGKFAGQVGWRVVELAGVFFDRVAAADNIGGFERLSMPDLRALVTKVPQNINECEEPKVGPAGAGDDILI